MSLVVYKILHILGLALLVGSLGGAAVHALGGGDRESLPKRGMLAAMHGIGMLLMIVAGFGMLAKLGGSMMPGWVHPKLLIWFFFGAAFTLLLRKPKSAGAIIWLVPILVAAAAALALYKPGA